MPEDHKVVCLVGSTQPNWKRQYKIVEEQLTHAGFVVISVVWFRGDLPNIDVCGKQGCKDFESHRELLEGIHRGKIRISDAVVLIHNDALSPHSSEEIKFAKSIGKPVVTFESIEQIVPILKFKITEQAKKDRGITRIKTLAMLKMEKNFVGVIEKRYPRKPYEVYSLEKLLERLSEEIAELKESIEVEDVNNAKGECADISNLTDFVFERLSSRGCK